MQLVQLELGISNQVIIVIISLFRVLLNPLKLITHLCVSEAGGARVSNAVAERL